jgi:hypothetical protein
MDSGDLEIGHRASRIWRSNLRALDCQMPDFTMPDFKISDNQIDDHAFDVFSLFDRRSHAR